MGKKNDKYKNYGSSSSSDSEDVVKLLKIVGSIILILLLFYFVFAIYKGEISFSKKEKEKEEVVIQNIEIPAGSTFKKEDSDYYVLFYDFEGNNAIKCSSIRALYTQSSSGIKMYTVDLNSAFSNSYLTDDINSVNADNLSTLKVVDATLIKVSNGKGSVIAAGIEALNNYSSELLKPIN